MKLRADYAHANSTYLYDGQRPTPVALLATPRHKQDAETIVAAVNVLPRCVEAMKAAELYLLRWAGAGPSLQEEEHAETLGTIRRALAAAKEIK